MYTLILVKVLPIMVTNTIIVKFVVKLTNHLNWLKLVMIQFQCWLRGCATRNFCCKVNVPKIRSALSFQGSTLNYSVFNNISIFDGAVFVIRIRYICAFLMKLSMVLRQSHLSAAINCLNLIFINNNSHY